MTAAAVSALVRPPRLVAGDRVGVVAPAGPVPPAMLEAGLDVLRDWGLKPVVAPHALDAHPSGYLAGADRARADDLLDAWCDPALAAVLCARGGYGTQRMVDLVDWDAMRRAAPKAFVGYSDVTVLHEAFATRLGLATLHGPMPGTPAFLADTAGRDHLRRTLFTPEDVQVLRAPAARALVPGRAAGVTLGGCLSLLASDIGTPTGRPSAAGGILLLEDTGEEAYRLDRFLTQLLRTGWLDGVAGIALGSWEGCGPDDEVRALLLDRLGPLGVPILEDLGFGHCLPALTVPLGVPAVLDADAGTLTAELPALG
ncbi:S66 peptidase family protein [Actinacidiphila paucisporea]|uniref:Muramoyltetrapeptide carboxypeptidase n=1 Tax=Actinacidiphila paucisporea TaxID=310782 RepID=A0A1M7JWH4_9ACTN|nr:LD-carboxypeptidase [Actinacidiphila paucisporea]SHM57440.1 muramoyltetrapeptide carboxypeptidase [Actinacidiphila paucisporea]